MTNNKNCLTFLGFLQQTVYDDVDLEDMTWNSELSAYTFQCPCGDLFQITPKELANGEEIARCPSCTLVVRVIYDPDDLPPKGKEDQIVLKCIEVAE